MSTQWIFGTSIDSKSDVDLSEYEGFKGYLVHLESPRCIIIACSPGFIDKAPISLGPDEGYYYRNTDRNLELIVERWLDDPIDDTDEIRDLLYEGAVHLEIWEEARKTHHALEDMEEDPDEGL